MTIGLIFLMALASVAGVLIVLIRTLGVERTLRHATLVDIGFTVLVCFALAGTLTGLLIGIVAGLVMTGTLTLWKAALARAERLRPSQAKPIGDGWEPKYGWGEL